MSPVLVRGERKPAALMPGDKDGAHLPLVRTGLLPCLSRQMQAWLDATTRLTGNGMRTTHTDPEDDRRVDPAMPSGSTSKTWNPAQHREFWTEIDTSRSTGSAASASQAMHPTHWRPQLHAVRGQLSIAGDTSEGSAAGPVLRSIDEISQLDQDALSAIQERVNQALANRGGS